jgi:ATP-dependent Clp protease ATP-binding subunit ClpA
VHRRDHAQRIPQIHREGRRAGTPLPDVKVEAPSSRKPFDPQGPAPKYEEHHKAEFTDKALEGGRQAFRPLHHRPFLPDKAIDVMDEAGSRARIGTMTRPPEVKAIEAEIEEIKAAEGTGHQRPGF